MPLQKLRCAACSREIDPLDPQKSGQVAGGEFGDFLRHAYEGLIDADGEREEQDVNWHDLSERIVCKLEEGPHRKLLESITSAYFVQCRDFYDTTRDDQHGFIDNKSAIQFTEDRLNPKYRLRAVLRSFPQNMDVWLVAHMDCLPEDLNAYDIALWRIDTEEKALQWTFHLAEKVQWHGRGWVQFLTQLFDRTGV